MKRKRTTRRRNDIFRCRRMCAHRYILKGKKHTHKIPTRNHCGCVTLLLHGGKKTKWRKESSQVAVIRWKKARKHNTQRKKNEGKKADLNWCTKNIRHKSLQQPNDICSEVVLRTSSGLSLFLFTRTRHLISQQQHQRHRRMVFFPLRSFFVLQLNSILITNLVCKCVVFFCAVLWYNNIL